MKKLAIDLNFSFTILFFGPCKALTMHFIYFFLIQTRHPLFRSTYGAKRKFHFFVRMVLIKHLVDRVQFNPHSCLNKNIFAYPLLYTSFQGQELRKRREISRIVLFSVQKIEMSNINRINTTRH